MNINDNSDDRPVDKDTDRILGIYFRSIKEQENEINDLREQVFHLTKDQLRLEWLLDKAYTIQLRDGDILTCRAAIDIAMEEELKQLK
jgi:hypothetical protein